MNSNHTHIRISSGMKKVINDFTIHKRDGTKVIKATTEEKLKWLWAEYCRLKGEENLRLKQDRQLLSTRQQHVESIVRTLNRK